VKKNVKKVEEGKLAPSEEFLDLKKSKAR